MVELKRGSGEPENRTGPEKKVECDDVGRQMCRDLSKSKNCSHPDEEQRPIEHDLGKS